MSIYKCKPNEVTRDGRCWYFKVPYTDRDGNRAIKSSKKFHTRNEAIIAESEFRLKSNTSQIDIPVNMNFKTLYNHFLEFRKTYVSDLTYYGYGVQFKYFKSLHKIKCVDFKAEHIELWKKEKKIQGLSIRYKNDLIKFWRSLLNYGATYHGFNFTTEYKKVTYFVNNTGIQERLVYYTPAEFDYYISGEDNLMYRCAFKFFYYCGLKTSELRALTWKDIDLRNKTVSINKLLLHYRAGVVPNYYISKPRNRATARIIPMHRSLIKDLRKYYSEIYKTEGFKRTDFIFSLTNGKTPISDTALCERNKNLAFNMGMKKLTFQQFRHSCAYLFLSNGATIVGLAKFLGLSEISDVYEMYSILLPISMVDVIGVINGLK